MKPSISIFTATYNRASLLERCYESLVEQTSNIFTWIIVDDGSTDSTHKLVQKWQKDKLIDIAYIYQDNSGKHVAHNNAVSHCKTDYILILDSDDILATNCVEVLDRYAVKINDNERISGIIGNKCEINERNACHDNLPKGRLYYSGLELYQKYNVLGDTLRLYKTKILKLYPFPVIENERFIYENIVFDQIDKKYKMMIIHETLYYYEYLYDGYTTNSAKVKKNNPIGYALSLNSSVKYSLNFKKRVNWSILYIIWCTKMGIQDKYKNFDKKFYYVALYPIAIICKIFRYPKFFFDIFEVEQS